MGATSWTSMAVMRLDPWARRYNWARSYRNEEVLIAFKMFDIDTKWAWEISMSSFTSRCIAMPTEMYLIRGNLTPLNWASHAPRTRCTMIGEVGRSQVFDSRQAKATDVFNMSLRCLQHLMANVIFGQHDGRKVQLFIIWCDLNGTHVNTGAYNIDQLQNVVK